MGNLWVVRQNKGAKTLSRNLGIQVSDFRLMLTLQFMVRVGWNIVNISCKIAVSDSVLQWYSRIAEHTHGSTKLVILSWIGHWVYIYVSPSVFNKVVGTLSWSGHWVAYVSPSVLHQTSGHIVLIRIFHPTFSTKVFGTLSWFGHWVGEPCVTQCFVPK